MKEIKIRNISFDVIGIDGLIHYEYVYDPTEKTLTELIDCVETFVWTGKDATAKIKSIVNKPKKIKVVKNKELVKVENKLAIDHNQLTLF